MGSVGSIRDCSWLSRPRLERSARPADPRDRVRRTIPGIRGEGDARVSEDENDADRRLEDEDPLEEPTQSMAGRQDSEAPDSSADAEGAGLETTTWSGKQAPPPVIEDHETVVARPVDEPRPEPEPEPEPVSEFRPDSISAASSEPGDIAEVSIQSSEASANSNIEEAPTLVSVTAVDPISDSIPKASIAPSSSLHPMLLERIEPSLGRGERLRLDAAHWRVSLGRADHNDIRLYTESASREHAVIAGNEAGEWVLTPAEGKSVSVDGDATTAPMILEVGMNLVMGRDHLRCVTEGLDRSQMGAQTAADVFNDESSGLAARLAGLGMTWWLIGSVALVGLVFLAIAWFGG